MSISLEDMDTLIDGIYALVSDTPGYHFSISPSKYRALQMMAQGKRFYRGKPHKRKSPMRQSREVRERRSAMKLYQPPMTGFNFALKEMYS